MAAVYVIDDAGYTRPSQLLTFLLRRGDDFPQYPWELTPSLDEKTWYSRMEALKKALLPIWSWPERVLFWSAFLVSITVPWPVIAAVADAMSPTAADPDDGSAVDPTTTSSATDVTASPTAALASATVSASARFAMRYLAKRRDTINDDSNDLFNGSDPMFPDNSDPDDGGIWAGSGFWSDDYSSKMRWAAIGILLAILLFAWIPWFFVSFRNKSRINKLVLEWNSADEQLGPARALSWSLDRAPSFRDAKMLLIRLPAPPAGAQGYGSSAYPPSYGMAPFGSFLPGYSYPPNGQHDTEERNAEYANIDPDAKDWINPPADTQYTQPQIHEMHEGNMDADRPRSATVADSYATEASIINQYAQAEQPYMSPIRESSSEGINKNLTGPAHNSLSTSPGSSVAVSTYSIRPLSHGKRRNSKGLVVDTVLAEEGTKASQAEKNRYSTASNAEAVAAVARNVVGGETKQSRVQSLIAKRSSMLGGGDHSDRARRTRSQWI